MRASSLNWQEIPNFSMTEWPDNVLYYMDERIIYALSDIRQKSGCPIYPSPVVRAHIRHDNSSSRHSTLTKSRLSDATDFFCSWENSMEILKAIQSHPVIQGYGVYDRMMYNGAPGEMAMFHIDTRPRGIVCWWGKGRDPVNYIYMSPEELQEYLKSFLSIKLNKED